MVPRALGRKGLWGVHSIPGPLWSKTPGYIPRYSLHSHQSLCLCPWGQALCQALGTSSPPAGLLSLHRRSVPVGSQPSLASLTPPVSSSARMRPGCSGSFGDDIRFSELKAQLSHSLGVAPGRILNLSVPQSPSQYNGDNNDDMAL